VTAAVHFPGFARVVFRVFHDAALTNVARHSNSVTAAVRLTRAPGGRGQAIMLTIEDAGTGMAGVNGAGEHNAGRGVGLSSMRERLRQIGGRLDIDTTIGRTVIKATVPTRA
jgi:two-component system NarL family sensor kinase